MMTKSNCIAFYTRYLASQILIEGMHQHSRDIAPCGFAEKTNRASLLFPFTILFFYLFCATLKYQFIICVSGFKVSLPLQRTGIFTSNNNNKGKI
jgi:hypothetical protein